MTLTDRLVARLLPLALLALAPPAYGCQTQIEAGANAEEADALIALLHTHHVGATKQRSARVNGEETFDVSVLNAELAPAIAVVRATSGCAKDPARAESTAEPAWIPTPTDEELHLNAVLSARLGGTIRILDGVVDARVHIAPARARLRSLGDPVSAPTAAVVVKHQPARAPSVPAIRSLVAHAVNGLRPEYVDVLLIETREPPPVELSQVGPIAVTSGSAYTLRLALVGVLVVVAAFVSLVAWAWRRTRLDLPGA